MISRTIATFAVVTLGVIAADALQAFPICERGRGTHCIVDGDTLIINGALMRLAKIDAPETWDARCDSEKRRGWITTRRLARLLDGEFDVSQTGQQAPDGRPLIVIKKEGRSVGDILVQEKLARLWYGDYDSWC